MAMVVAQGICSATISLGTAARAPVVHARIAVTEKPVDFKALHRQCKSDRRKQLHSPSFRSRVSSAASAEEGSPPAEDAEAPGAIAEDAEAPGGAIAEASAESTDATESAEENPSEEAAEGAEATEEAVPRLLRPKGYSLYETMVVIRPDIGEEARTTLARKYEQMITANGGVEIEIFNRGIRPLSYAIKKVNNRGQKSIYLDGIYYLFTYVSKPGGQNVVQTRLDKDDDVIRASTVKMK